MKSILPGIWPRALSVAHLNTIMWTLITKLCGCFHNEQHHYFIKKQANRTSRKTFRWGHERPPAKNKKSLGSSNPGLSTSSSTRLVLGQCHNPFAGESSAGRRRGEPLLLWKLTMLLRAACPSVYAGDLKLPICFFLASISGTFQWWQSFLVAAHLGYDLPAAIDPRPRRKKTSGAFLGDGSRSLPRDISWCVKIMAVRLVSFY